MSYKIRKIVALFLVFAAPLLLVSCARTWDGKRGGRVSGHASGRGPGDKGGVQKEILRPSETNYAMNLPARNASMAVVEDGKKLLDKGECEQALGKFHDAVLIDNSNGVAYYYLAKTHVCLKNYSTALGILDKAASLFANLPQWIEAVELLKKDIEEKMADTSNTSKPL